MTDNISPRAETPRRIKILLGISLAFNLAFVGLLAGAMWRHGGPGSQHGAAPGLSAYARPYVMALPRSERRAMLRDMRQHAGESMPDRGARRAVYADVLAQLRRDPFDPAALTAALERQSRMTTNVQEAAQAAWLRRVLDMDAAARLAYAAAIEDELQRGPRHQKMHD
jgi:uncharacterized membrane protein